MIAFKNMKMPKNCLNCQVYEPQTGYCYGSRRYVENIEENKRPLFCKAIEVPTSLIGKILLKENE